ncbi:hypothetical protein BV61_04695 [Candidatus Synechococcus spongiarum LMB bulk15M]|uniref:Uncharacterized protein n=3 Tax=Candidatus Synechococcus spongiarum TaxID=431041 RepID=A0A1T1CS02_9SYNE|nr:hypothetical protein BV61_04695 [Candidatus Synechococcus spongiarum LMB bulk15M]OOV34043.1 hypothetical protein BV53_06505 [Candidatus Synechococcus spongiarum LMB bulk15N]
MWARLTTIMTQDVYRRRPGHVLGNLVEAGRDLVHGAAGARPGSQRRRNGGGISQVSRWVGEGINWLLEEDSNSSAQETTLREPQSPIHGRRSSRTGRTANHAAAGTEPPWSNPGNDGLRRRPLQVIPHPAPPLLPQAEPSPDRWQETPSAAVKPRQPFGNQDASGSPRRDGGSGLSRPRPRSSRRIQPGGQDS